MVAIIHVAGIKNTQNGLIGKFQSMNHRGGITAVLYDAAKKKDEPGLQDDLDDLLPLGGTIEADLEREVDDESRFFISPASR